MSAQPKSSPTLGDAKTIAPLIGMLPYTLLALARARKIPSIRLGHRTVLFDLNEVRAALKKFTVKEVA